MTESPAARLRELARLNTESMQGNRVSRGDFFDAVHATDFAALADEVEQVEKMLGFAFDEMDAAARWAATQTGGVRTVADIDAHVAGFDRLVDATAKVGVAAGKLGKWDAALAASVPTERAG